MKQKEINGWMDGWMNPGAWMDGWVPDGMGGWVSGWMDGWMDGTRVTFVFPRKSQIRLNTQTNF